MNQMLLISIFCKWKFQTKKKIDGKPSRTIFIIQLTAINDCDFLFLFEWQLTTDERESITKATYLFANL
jgi:hypothetical protein